MKKVLIGLLALSALSFASVEGQRGSTNSASMTVKARVIRALRIQSVGDLDFGSIIEGNSKSAVSSYKIEGEAGMPIDVSIPSSVELKNESGNTIVVNLRNGLPKSIGADGSTTASIDGKIEIPVGQDVGNYTGELLASVRYQ